MFTARLRYSAKLAGAGFLAIFVFAVAVALAIPLSLPNDHNGLLPTLAVSEARAVAAANAKPPRLDEAASWTRQSLSQRPGDATAWARLAWIAGERGDISTMRDALDRSYSVAPFGPEITRWRLRYTYDRWPDLTPDLRRQAAAELAVTARTRPGLVEQVRGEIVDPAGRLAFMLEERNASLVMASRREQKSVSAPAE